MKRFFIILFSTVMLISVAFFVSCGDESSSDDGSPSGGSFVESPGTTALSAPSGLTATAASSSSVEVSWYPVSGAVGYYVYASEYSSSSTVSLVSTTSSTSTTVTDLEAGTKYYFWVKAYKGTATSDYSSYAYATTNLLTAPSAPQNVMAKASGLRCIDVSWDAVDDASSYVVYHRPSEGDGQESGTESTHETTSTYITIDYLVEDKTYDFWIIAKNSIGESGRSDVVSARQYFPAPTNVRVYVTGTGYAHVSCDRVLGATGYEIYAQRDDYGFSYEIVFLKSSESSTYVTVGGLASGGHYYFYVKAVCGTKTSDFSSRSSQVLIH